MIHTRGNHEYFGRCSLHWGESRFMPGNIMIKTGGAVYSGNVMSGSYGYLDSYGGNHDHIGILLVHRCF